MPSARAARAARLASRSGSRREARRRWPRQAARPEAADAASSRDGRFQGGQRAGRRVPAVARAAIDGRRLPSRRSTLPLGGDGGAAARVARARPGRRPAAGQRCCGSRAAAQPSAGPERAGQVPAVDGGDVARRSGPGSRVVPVERWPSSAPGLDASSARPSSPPAPAVRDEAEVVGGQGGQQAHADVGRRGAMRDARARDLLEVVRRQAMVLLAREGLEVRATSCARRGGGAGGPRRRARCRRTGTGGSARRRGAGATAHKHEHGQGRGQRGGPQRARTSGQAQQRRWPGWRLISAQEEARAGRRARGRRPPPSPIPAGGAG